MTCGKLHIKYLQYMKHMQKNELPPKVLYIGHRGFTGQLVVNLFFRMPGAEIISEEKSTFAERNYQSPLTFTIPNNKQLDVLLTWYNLG